MQLQFQIFPNYIFMQLQFLLPDLFLHKYILWKGILKLSEQTGWLFTHRSHPFLFDGVAKKHADCDLGGGSRLLATQWLNKWRAEGTISSEAFLSP